MKGRILAAVGLAALLSARQFAVWAEPLQRFHYHWTRDDALAFLLSMGAIAVALLGGERLLRLLPGPVGRRWYRTIFFLVLVLALGSWIDNEGRLPAVRSRLAALTLFAPLILLAGGGGVAAAWRARAKGWLTAAPGRHGASAAALMLALALLTWTLFPWLADRIGALIAPPPRWIEAVYWSLLLWAVWYLAHPSARGVLAVARAIPTIAVALAALIAVQIFWWSPWGPDTTRAAPAVGGGHGTPVVLIIFDEWSRGSAISPDGVVRPELLAARGFAARGVTYPSARSPGTSTLVSLPRLLAQGDGDLQVRDRYAGWRLGDSVSRFDRDATIISAAVAAGYQVDIIGFYLPYARLFGAQARQVLAPSWTPRPRSLLQGVSGALRRSVYYWPVPGVYAAVRHEGWWGLPRHDDAWYQLQEELTDSAVAVLERIGAGEMAIIHLPTPHPPLVRRPDGSRAVPPARHDTVALREGYDAQVRYTDAQLGRLLAALRRSGVAENALVVITSDHGWRSSPDQDPRDPEELLDVPLWIAWPGGPVGEVDGRPICTAGLGSLFALAFAGSEALRAEGRGALDRAVDAPGCRALPPPRGREWWF